MFGDLPTIMMSYALLRGECVFRTSSYIYAIHVHVLVFFFKVYTWVLIYFMNILIHRLVNQRYG